MKRPSIPSKPDAPSVKAMLAPAVGRARRLRKDEQPQTESELVADIERELQLPQALLDLMRERARRTDESR